jgi:TonB family protein
MSYFRSNRAQLFPLALLLAGVITQADAASWFHDSNFGTHRNVGSGPNPAPKDLIAIQQGPDYPLESRMFGEQGKVGLKVWLTEQGTMTDAVVEHSSGYPRLDEAAVRYVRDRWHYKPAAKDAPMPKTILADVMFKLN